MPRRIRKNFPSCSIRRDMLGHPFRIGSLINRTIKRCLCSCRNIRTKIGSSIHSRRTWTSTNKANQQGENELVSCFHCVSFFFQMVFSKMGIEPIPPVLFGPQRDLTRLLARAYACSATLRRWCPWRDSNPHCQASETCVCFQLDYRGGAS